MTVLTCWISVRYFEFLSEAMMVPSAVQRRATLTSRYFTQHNLAVLTGHRTWWDPRPKEGIIYGERCRKEADQSCRTNLNPTNSQDRHISLTRTGPTLARPPS